MQQLQCIQNTAARIVTQEWKFCHITPILKDLHWLPVAARIEFKVLWQVYKCLHGTAPDYLSSTLQKYACPKPNMTMRSAMDTLKLYQPSFNVNKFATEPFQWLDLASGMSCRGGSDTVLVSPPSSRHWRPISTVENSSLYLPNFLTLFFLSLPGAHQADRWLRLRPHYYYYYYYLVQWIV